MSLVREGSELSREQKKYCSCLLKKHAKDMSSKSVGQYNDYAVCTSSTGGHVYSCTPYYDFDNMQERYLRAYLDMHREPYEGETRQELLDEIHRKIQGEQTTYAPTYREE